MVEAITTYYKCLFDVSAFLGSPDPEMIGLSM